MERTMGKLEMARADLEQIRALVRADRVGIVSFERALECAEIIAFAHRRNLAETLQAIDFDLLTEELLSNIAEEHSREAKEDMITTLIQAVVKKVLGPCAY